MSSKIPVPVAVVVIVVLAAVIVWFGWRKVSGADNDATKANIDRYDAMVSGKAKVPAGYQAPPGQSAAPASTTSK